MKLSQAQWRMLRGAAEGDPFGHIRGAAAHGGADGTLRSLVRRGLLGLGFRGYEITEVGRELLKKHDKE